MSTVTVSRNTAQGLPQGLRSALAAVQLPEVQEMLRRLSEFRLGIFMPHMHDEQTGEFQPLPDELMQVESGLEVSFQPAEEIARQTDRFLPVSWIWGAGAPTPSAVCEMVREEGSGDTGRYDKHKMPKGN